MNQDFEKNKKALLEKITALHHSDLPHSEPLSKQAFPDVIVFGALSPFMEGLIDALEKKRPLEFFQDPGKATDYCLDHEVSNVILDMDLPTDWKMATDVFYHRTNDEDDPAFHSFNEIAAINSRGDLGGPGR